MSNQNRNPQQNNQHIPPRLRWLTEGAPQALANIFTDAEHDIYLVGGAVRDALLGNQPEDLDFATDARPDRIKTLLSEWADHLYDIGEKFGTIGAVQNGIRYEVTTFRADSYQPNTRRPEVIFGNSIEDDLKRRDFTVNAIALKLTAGTPILVDPMGGLEDLTGESLRTPIGPEVSFSDDPLRMVRLFRFAAKLGFTPQPAELEAVTRMKERLQIVSAERIRDEFSKLVTEPDPAAAMQLMIETGLAAEFIPEVSDLAVAKDPDHRHKDVLAHSLAVLTKTEPDLVLRLATLFHDVGKPSTRQFEGTKVTFYAHDIVGAEMTERRLRKLRYPGDIIKDVTELVSLHMRTHSFKMGWSDSAVRRYVRDAGHLLPKLNQLIRCDVTTNNNPRFHRIQKHIDNLEARIEQLRARENLESLRPPINGRHVMSYLGIDPGPTVGVVMNLLREKRIDDGPYDPEDGYELIREWALSEGLPDPGPPPMGNH